MTEAQQLRTVNPGLLVDVLRDVQKDKGFDPPDLDRTEKMAIFIQKKWFISIWNKMSAYDRWQYRLSNHQEVPGVCILGHQLDFTPSTGVERSKTDPLAPPSWEEEKEMNTIFTISPDVGKDLKELYHQELRFELGYDPKLD